MIVKRTSVSPPGSGGFVHFELFIVQCEACAFSAASRFEADAVAIVERHQARCAKYLETRREEEPATSK